MAIGCTYSDVDVDAVPGRASLRLSLATPVLAGDSLVAGQGFYAGCMFSDAKRLQELLPQMDWSQLTKVCKHCTSISDEPQQHIVCHLSAQRKGGAEQHLIYALLEVHPWFSMPAFVAVAAADCNIGSIML